MDKNMITFIDKATKEELIVVFEAIKNQKQDKALIKNVADLIASQRPTI